MTKSLSIKNEKVSVSCKTKNSNSGLFAGAGVIVCEMRTPDMPDDAIIVETKYAKQVSNLFFSLKEIFASNLDYCNKYEFYGRLANVANILLNDDFNSDASVLESVIIKEACMMASEMKAHLYFAYGSNMDTEQMEYRCSDALFVGTAKLPDFEFNLDEIGVATVEKRKGSKVYGTLWLISDTDEQSLDRYEGVRSGCYRKETCFAIDSTDKTYEALVYISNRNSHNGTSYRSGYMDNIIKNAKRLNFDAAYIDWLEEK